MDGITDGAGKYTQCVNVYVAVCTEGNHEDGANPNGSPCLANAIDFFWSCWNAGSSFPDTGDGIGPSTEGPGDMGSGGGGGPVTVDTPPNNCSHCNEVITLPVIELAEDSPRKKKCQELNEMGSKPIANTTPPKTVLSNLNDLTI